MRRTLSLGAVALASRLRLGLRRRRAGCRRTTAAEAEPAAPEPAPRVEAADIDAALANGAVLLDVRTDEELAEHGTIDGFVHIPIDELEARMGELPAGVPVLTA